MVDEVRHAVEGLTEAMEVSVQQLGAVAPPDEELLRESTSAGSAPRDPPDHGAEP